MERLCAIATYHFIIISLCSLNATWLTPDAGALNCRWSLPSGHEVNCLNIAVNDWSTKEVARIWVFNPHGTEPERIMRIEVREIDHLQSLIEAIKAMVDRIQRDASMT